MTADFTINGNVYRIGTKLDAFKQWGIVRRLAPVIVDLVGARDAFVRRDEVGHLDRALRLLTAAIGKISDDDAQFVFSICLAATLRQQGSGWAAVALPGGQLMFADISLPEVLGITVRVILDHLSGFTDALPSDLKSAAGAI